jgi:HTH-type transcriptional regulator/antitoxin HigA
MTTELKPIRSDADHEKALREVESLWGANSGTAKGDRLDILVTLTQFLSRYPVLNIQEITSKHAIMNPAVMLKLTTTFTSATS